MAAREMDILLVVVSLDVDRVVEIERIKACIHIKQMDSKNGPGKLDMIVAVEAFFEEVKRIMTMSSELEEIIYKPEPKIMLIYF